MPTLRHPRRAMAGVGIGLPSLLPTPHFLPVTYFSLAGSRWGGRAPPPPRPRSAAPCGWVTGGSTRACLRQKGHQGTLSLPSPGSPSPAHPTRSHPVGQPALGTHGAGRAAGRCRGTWGRGSRGPVLTLPAAAADLAEEGALAEVQQALLLDQLQQLRLQPLTQLPGARASGRGARPLQQAPADLPGPDGMSPPSPLTARAQPASPPGAAAPSAAASGSRCSSARSLWS